MSDSLKNQHLSKDPNSSSELNSELNKENSNITFEKIEYDSNNNSNKDHEFTDSKSNVRQISSEDIEKTLLLASNYRKRVERDESSKVITSPGYYTFEDVEVVALPPWCENNFDLLPILIKRLSLLTERKVVFMDSIKTKKPDLNQDIERLITGLIVAIECDFEKVSFNKHKERIEMGRRIGLAYRCLGEFEKRKWPTSLLKKNHAFFENHPMIGVNEKNKEIPMLDKYLLNFINDTELRALTGTLIRTVFKKIALTSYKEDDANKLLLPCVITFESYMTRFYRLKGFSKEEKKQSKRNKKYKKPLLPTRSNVFTKNELKIIRKIMKPSFQNPSMTSEKWQSKVLFLTKSDLEDLDEGIRVIYNKRWELLESFGRMSTRRLKKFRKFSNKPNMKKKDISEEMVLSFISNLGPAYCYTVITELKLLLGDAYKHNCNVFLKKDPTSSSFDEDMLNYIFSMSGMVPPAKKSIKTYMDSLKEKADRIEMTNLFNGYSLLTDLVYHEKTNKWYEPHDLPLNDEKKSSKKKKSLSDKSSSSDEISQEKKKHSSNTLGDHLKSQKK